MCTAVLITGTPPAKHVALQDFNHFKTLQMKNNLHTNPLLFKLLVFVTCFMLVILYNKAQAETPVPKLYHGPEVVVNIK